MKKRPAKKVKKVKKVKRAKVAVKRRAVKKPAKKTKAKVKAKAKAKAKPPKQGKAKAKPAKPPAAGKWVKFVEHHGVVLASARGPVPSVAETIAGEAIVGSWWSHPKAQTIFDALSSIGNSDDVRAFKLVDNKITFVHRRAWPALAKLAEAGVLARERAALIQQEHLPTGEHRNFITAYPDWVSEDVAAAAGALSIADARAQLGSWLP